ncbi:MAG: effector-associated domain 2-containing protein [Pseudonocardiaceae bacterium]
MAEVFINYRSDAAAWAVVLDHALSDRFGADRVFRAPRSIKPSEDFIDQILQNVRRCSVLLAVIGPAWLAAGSNGRRRIDDDSDWVRREIAEALGAAVPIVPILTDDAPHLDAAELPADIAALGRCQYLRLHHRNTAYDLRRIGDELAELVPDLVKSPPSRSGPVRPAAPPAGTAYTSDLSPEVVWRLVETLASLRTMIDAGTRHQIVEALPSAVVVQIRRHSAVLPDVHAIVTGCLEHDGVLDVLLTAVRRLEGPSWRMRELEDLLDDLGIGDTR